MLTKENILASSDLETEEVEIPEWGGTVMVRTMTGRERDRFETAHQANPGVDIRARLAVSCVVGEDGQLLFSDADIPALSLKSSAALDRIFAVGTRLSKIGAADIRELAKNSPASHSNGSPSGSPSHSG